MQKVGGKSAGFLLQWDRYERGRCLHQMKSGNVCGSMWQQKKANEPENERGSDEFGEMERG